MQSLAELGEVVAVRRKSLGLSQSMVAARSGLTRETIVRFERGQVTEFGSRKLLAVLAVLKMEMAFAEVGVSGTLDELRIERASAARFDQLRLHELRVLEQSVGRSELLAGRGRRKAK